MLPPPALVAVIVTVVVGVIIVVRLRISQSKLGGARRGFRLVIVSFFGFGVVVAVVVDVGVVVVVGVIIIVIFLLKVSRRPKNQLRSSRSKSRGARRGFQLVILSFFGFGVVDLVLWWQL